MPQKPFFITTPIYYINSTPHIGHASTQIAADARARFERLRGRHVYFLTGTDENALKVARAAQEQGKEPQAFCDELAAAFIEVWQALNISYDDFLRTTEARHTTVVQEVVQRLWDDGHLELGKYSGWYSVPDETFFREEETVARDRQHFLLNPSEDQTKGPLEWVEETGHFFKLSEFQDVLLEIYAERGEEMLQPETRRNETLSFIKMGLRDTSISRVQNWGIPMPDGVPESAGQVVYVWFPDALLNYATAPGYRSQDPERRAFFEEIWPPDLQLMSKDIFTRFHATLWPALLQALELPLPKKLFAHGFWTVNGHKMSKRDPETIIEPVAFSHHVAQLSGCEFSIAVDALRYHCLREVNFGSDGDFSPDACLLRYNSDLANGLGNLLQRTLSMLHKYFEGAVPSASGQTLGLRSLLPAVHQEIADRYENLDFSGALMQVWEVIGEANRLIEEQKPWAKVKTGQLDDVAELLHELLAVCAWCGVATFPVMPSVGAAMWQALALDEPLSWAAPMENLFAPGHKCPPPQGLFPRIAAEKIAAPTSKLTMNETQHPVPPTSPQSVETTSSTIENAEKESDLITIDDFARVELRVAKVLEAERVPKADKLLRLQVDMGTEQRQILAGIAQHYEPTELIGKSVVVVANLAPRTLRGYESQGMVLAASTEGEPLILSLISPEKDLTPGAKVR